MYSTTYTPKANLHVSTIHATPRLPLQIVIFTVMVIIERLKKVNRDSLPFTSAVSIDESLSANLDNDVY